MSKYSLPNIDWGTFNDATQEILISSHLIVDQMHPFFFTTCMTERIIVRENKTEEILCTKSYKYYNNQKESSCIYCKKIHFVYRKKKTTVGWTVGKSH